MSIHLEHELQLARAWILTGDPARGVAQLERVRSLDHQGAHAREVRILSIVLAARRRMTDQAAELLASLGQLSAQEHAMLDRLMASVPEVSNPAYHAWAAGFIASAAPHAHSPSGVRGGGWRGLLSSRHFRIALASGLVVVVALGALGYLLWPRPASAPDSLRRALVAVEAGDMVAIWDALPPTYQLEADRAMHELVASVPNAKAFTDHRQVDQLIAAVIRERADRLPISREDSVARLFRSFLHPAEDMATLADFYEARSQSPVWDPQWLRQASVRDVLVELRSLGFQDAWDLLFRLRSLESSGWAQGLGLQAPDLGKALAAARQYAVVRPDSGGGTEVVAILLPGKETLEVTMRRDPESGRWIPEPVFESWRLVMNMLQRPTSEQSAAANRLRAEFQAHFDLARLDQQKQALMRARAAPDQKEFDLAIAQFARASE